MEKMNFKNNILWPAVPLAVACLTVGFTLFSCADKDIETDDSNGKALVAFNVSETQDQAQAGAKAYGPISRTAFTRELALQDLTPEDLTMQKLPVQGAAGAGLCLIETTVAGVPSQLKAEVSTRANITTMATLQHFSTTAFYGSSDATLEPWFYDKETKEDGTLVSPMYWDWFKNHACFYAVYPRPYSKLVLSPESHTGTPYVNFTVEPDVKNQKDLMTACSGNVHSTIGTMSATAPRTDLTFRHALTAVRFKVGQNLSYSKYITKVEIIGAKSKGKYILPIDKTLTGTWEPTSLSTPTTFTLGGDGTVNVSTSEAVNNVIMGNTGDNFTFYMIPQSLAGVQVKVYFSDGSTPITANLAGTWKPGTTKTYALSQNNSTWDYQLTITPPVDAEYNATAIGNYTVQSYREDPVSHTQQKVAWKVVGYDINEDGIYTLEEKPNWMTLNMTNGEGSTDPSGEIGNGTLVPDFVDKLAERNANLKLNPKGTASNYYDLSLHDVKGNVTTRNTANCYVISHPGFYKIPLVYGNAIKNNRNNANAYYTTKTGVFVMQHFKDHNDQNITDPWIERTNSGANNGVNDAKVVWADEANLVHFGSNKIVRSGGETFLQFEVKAEDIKQGNAVVAVMKDNVIVWSWHLWYAPETALNTIEVQNYQNVKYNFTEETLGWKYTSFIVTNYSAPRKVKVKVEQTMGNSTKRNAELTITQKSVDHRPGYPTYFQFGRKDAFAATDDIKEGSLSYLNISSSRSIAENIQNPNIFYHHAYHPYTPYYPTCINPWSVNNEFHSTFNPLLYNDDAVIKSVYDPCPAGFHLPPSNAFTGFTKNGENMGPINGRWGETGWFFNNKVNSPDATIYFPATGYRRFSTTINYLNAMNSYGFYWTAISSDSHGIIMHFQNTNAVWTKHINARAATGAIRPVLDINHNGQHEDTEAGGSLGN
ncbi:fimbrillin family protein [Hoylesella marshii]|uniref:fimbrillin family protein n=1 Tax=Hoylesella marshii TaxID=189722 RepID=UPI0028D5370E|nr:fimbrillin family protein [Hoylesella marshii]